MKTESLDVGPQKVQISFTRGFQAFCDASAKSHESGV
jgi:hypothetical protein